MDGRGFDDLVRQLAQGRSRRVVLRGLIGGGAILATTKPGAGRAAPAAKVEICHLDDEGGYHLIRINGNALDAHLAHGDQFPEDCNPDCNCCISDFESGCLSNDECCSDICQSGLCVPTIAGTCESGDNLCDGPTTECGVDCFCGTLSDGSTVCIGNGLCADSCDECLEGFICEPNFPAPCCGGGAACLLPCPPEGGVGCFTAETRIAMANGTSRPISEVMVGDEVLGMDGQINRVEAIDRPRLGSKSLYAHNGSGYFVTAEHPFMTEDGWKAIDPATTARTHPTLELGRLKVGDRLLVLSGVLAPVGAGGGWASEPAEVRIEPVLVAQIESASEDPATQLYNLRLDGNHTYFANDMLVHNK